MRKYILRLKKNLLKLFFSPVCRKEWKNQSFSHFNERAVEYRFVFEWVSKIMPRKLLDIGTGETSLPALIRTCGPVVTATDNIKDYWTHGLINRHWLIIDDDIRNTKITDTFDLITCVSVLEHIKEYDAAVKSMFSLLNKGGHLLLTFPYNEQNYKHDAYELPDSNAYAKKLPFSTQIFARKQINAWLSGNNGEIIAQEYWRFFSGDFWSTGSRLETPVKTEREKLHQLSCLIIRKK